MYAVPTESASERRASPRYHVAHAGESYLSRRFWRVPVRLLEDGTFARLWRIGPSASGTLAILALHAYPTLLGDEWTGPIDLTAERIAAMNGVSLRTTVAMLGGLRGAGFIRQESRPHPAGGAFQLRRYFVRAALYARCGERYFSFGGSLVADLEWANMPSPAHRHRYLVLGALNPVQSEQAYAAAIVERPWGEELGTDDEVESAIRARREHHWPSVRRFARLSGMSVGLASQLMRGSAPDAW